MKKNVAVFLLLVLAVAATAYGRGAGTVYVGTDDKKLYALGVETRSASSSR